jgi:hypothetical protein
MIMALSLIHCPFRRLTGSVYHLLHTYIAFIVILSKMLNCVHLSVAFSNFNFRAVVFTVQIDDLYDVANNTICLLFSWNPVLIVYAIEVWLSVWSSGHFLILFSLCEDRPLLSKFSRSASFGILVMLHRWGIGPSNSPYVHRMAQIQKKLLTFVRAPSWIRTHDSSVRAV